MFIFFFQFCIGVVIIVMVQDICKYRSFFLIMLLALIIATTFPLKYACSFRDRPISLWNWFFMPDLYAPRSDLRFRDWDAWPTSHWRRSFPPCSPRALSACTTWVWECGCVCMCVYVCVCTCARSWVSGYVCFGAIYLSRYMLRLRWCRMHYVRTWNRLARPSLGVYRGKESRHPGTEPSGPSLRYVQKFLLSFGRHTCQP